MRKQPPHLLSELLRKLRYLDEADQLASDIMIIDHGRVIAAGTPSELKSKVGHDVIEVHTVDADGLPRVADALRTIDPHLRLDPGTRRITVAVDDGTSRLMDAVRAHDAMHVAVEDIALRRPTLDEVFLALTGQPVDATESDARSHRAA